MKQKRWNRKWLALSLLIVHGMTAGMSMTVMANAEEETKAQNMEERETEAQDTKVQSGERTATIMVVSITGNEMTYYEMEDETESESEQETERATQQSETESSEEAKGGQIGSPEGMTQKDETKGRPGDFGNNRETENQNTRTVYLPVPVVVHTDTDETRTFSILEAGDRLQVTIVTDEEGKETITEIWMLNT